MQFTTQTSKQSDELKVKFYFDKSKESGVELMFITDEMRREAHKKLVREDVEFAIHPNTKKLTKVVTPDFNVEDLERWFLDTLITDWWGIFLDKKEIKPTSANKYKLYKDQKVFRDFIDKKNDELQEMAKETFGGTSSEKN